jgi:hypothetical protein
VSLDAREEEAAVLQLRVLLLTKRFLHIDCGPGQLCALIKQRCGAETAGVYLGDDPAERQQAAAGADLVFSDIAAAFEAGGHYDSIVITRRGGEELAPLAGLCARLLHPEGRLVVFYADAGPAAALAPLEFFGRWPAVPGVSDPEGPFVPAPGEPRVEVYTQPGYAPYPHAQRLAGAREFDKAYELLGAITPECRADPEFDTRVQMLKMVCLIGLMKVAAYPPLTCLAGAFYLFSRVQRRTPNQPEIFRLFARFWDAAGGAGMAARLRILANELEGKRVCVPPSQLAKYESPVVAMPAQPIARRVLFVTGCGRVNYGLDVLYHGLKRVLGEGNVTDFPYKPTLHGAPAERFGHYPALFAHEGPKLDDAEALALLRAGAFDLIVWGDIEMMLPQALARALIAARGETPVVFVDMGDDCADHAVEVAAWIGLDAPPRHFKREMLRGVRYTEGTRPLPFAYPDALVTASPDGPRKAPLFWAGQRGWGFRDVFLPVLEARGYDTRQAFTQEAYREMLRHVRGCLSLGGAGFDTVRYWEAPAHGCLLLSETLPTIIPHDFEDMRDALFFSTRAEMDARIEFLLAFPEKCDEYRHAGWQKLREHHTASARARQFLAQV